jgi:hypothetical protein
MGFEMTDMNQGLRRLLTVLSMLVATSQVLAQQHVYQIRADSVRIYSACDTAELIIENKTRDTLGFLFNKGNGRTEFRKLQLQTIGGNAIAITGQDTLQLGTIIKTAVDTLYTSGTTLYYRKTNGTVVTVPLNLNAWGDGRYDLVSTNAAVVPDSGIINWSAWPADKVVGYFAYHGADMPPLSNQAFQNVGSPYFYNGLVYRHGNTGFDMAVNWNSENRGPNGFFVRTKDDTNLTGWGAWRELMFKDYADNAFAKRSSTSFQTTGPGWYRIALNGTAKPGEALGSRAYGRFILTDATSALHQTVEFIASVNFNAQPFIKLLGNGTYNSYPFAAIRMVKGATYEGTAIEVLVTRTEPLTVKAVMLDNEQTAGWTMVNWEKTVATTGMNDGIPATMSQVNFVLNSGAVEGTSETSGYWQYMRNAGLQTNGGFRHRSYLGLVGDYGANGTAQKVIWTIGDNYISTGTYCGLGYDFGSQVTATADHQIVIASNGTITHRFNMKGGVSLTGDLKTSGSTTSTGFFQSSLRSLKKDITLFNADALTLINQLKIMEFTYKDDPGENRHVGIIADESDWHFATKDQDKFDINSSISITMKAIQELTEKIDALNKRIDALEAKSQTTAAKND